ncbi:helix-turn-helix domain-containing protein [Heliobacterium chlorum]|uniref:Helix-turn-helix domain-containing protein n=2 Tax=Heliobacterium chlorum TaxID=2698 RepID=A0ABR7SYF6_HELCL|nr:helix-turn-helix domain-containing protein [Heliobacterium chlorum]
MTQAELARLVDVGRSLINQIESGQSKPSLLTAIKIAVVLNKPVEELFQIENNDWRLRRT